MGTKHVTYTDPDGSAPKVEFHGHTFIAGVPAKLDEDHPAVKAIEAVEHPHFEFGTKRFAGSPAYDQGKKAGEDAEDGDPMVVPTKIRGTAEASHFEAGYEDGKRGSVAPVISTAIAGAASPNSGLGDAAKQLPNGSRTTPAKPS